MLAECSLRIVTCSWGNDCTRRRLRLVMVKVIEKEGHVCLVFTGQVVQNWVLLIDLDLNFTGSFEFLLGSHSVQIVATVDKKTAPSQFIYDWIGLVVNIENSLSIALYHRTWMLMRLIVEGANVLEAWWWRSLLTSRVTIHVDLCDLFKTDFSLLLQLMLTGIKICSSLTNRSKQMNSAIHCNRLIILQALVTLC